MCLIFQYLINGKETNYIVDIVGIDLENYVCNNRDTSYQQKLFFPQWMSAVMYHIFQII